MAKNTKQAVLEQPKTAGLEKLNISVGNLSKKSGQEPKTSGIKTRGNGAATKGVTARGPMA